MSYRAKWRLANQQKKGMLDFSASERCIEAIARRGELRAVNRVIDRIMKEPEAPKPDTSRQVPPHRSGGSGFYFDPDLYKIRLP